MTTEDKLQLMKVVCKVIEAGKRPGVMSLAGMQAEVKCRKEVASYFKILGSKVAMAHLEKLANAGSKEQARHSAEMKASQVVRRSSDLLTRILKGHLYDALLVADKQHVGQEAGSPVEVRYFSGLLSADAEEYAASHAAEQVTGINKFSVKAIADLVANAVGNQFTPAQLSLDIGDLFTDWTKSRANLIAVTEMADAFGEAALRKLQREEVAYKQLILSPLACPVCESIVEAGPVPVGEPFVDDNGEEYDRSPIHAGCRCATTGARAPEDEGD